MSEVPYTPTEAQEPQTPSNSEKSPIEDGRPEPQGSLEEIIGLRRVYNGPEDYFRSGTTTPRYPGRQGVDIELNGLINLPLNLKSLHLLLNRAINNNLPNLKFSPNSLFPS